LINVESKKRKCGKNDGPRGSWGTHSYYCNGETDCRWARSKQTRMSRQEKSIRLKPRHRQVRRHARSHSTASGYDAKAIRRRGGLPAYPIISRNGTARARPAPIEGRRQGHAGDGDDVISRPKSSSRTDGRRVSIFQDSPDVGKASIGRREPWQVMWCVKTGFVPEIAWPLEKPPAGERTRKLGGDSFQGTTPGVRGGGTKAALWGSIRIGCFFTAALRFDQIRGPQDREEEKKPQNLQGE